MDIQNGTKRLVLIRAMFFSSKNYIKDYSFFLTKNCGFYKTISQCFATCVFYALYFYTLNFFFRIVTRFWSSAFVAKAGVVATRNSTCTAKVTKVATGEVAGEIHKCYR